MFNFTIRFRIDIGIIRLSKLNLLCVDLVNLLIYVFHISSEMIMFQFLFPPSLKLLLVIDVHRRTTIIIIMS